MIIARKEKRVTYADLIREAKQKVSLAECGVKIVTTRFTKKGEIVIEMRGGTEEEKIAEFASRVQAALGDKAEVRRPQRKTELLILGIEASATAADIKAATEVGSEAEVLNLSATGRGCQMARVRVPIPIAVEAMKKGEIGIGWSQCRVRSLEKKDSQPRCYRCLRRGHIAASCESEPIGTGCYRCGEEGHRLRECRMKPKCPVCSREEGRNAEHIVGSKGCLGAAAPRNITRGGRRVPRAARRPQ